MLLKEDGVGICVRMNHIDSVSLNREINCMSVLHENSKSLIMLICK